MFKKKRRFIIKYYVDLTCYFLDYYLSIAIKAGGSGGELQFREVRSAAGKMKIHFEKHLNIKMYSANISTT